MPLIRCGLLAVALVATAVSCRADEESTATQVVYKLEINGKSYVVDPDKPLEIDGRLRNPTITLRVARTRSFQEAGISFDYPSHFSYEADKSDPELLSWTLSGDDVDLTVFQCEESLTAKALAEATELAIGTGFGATSTSTEPIALKLGNSERTGVKLTMQFETSTQIHQFVNLPATDAGSRLLVIEEDRPEGQPESPELAQTLKYLASSFKKLP